MSIINADGYSVFTGDDSLGKLDGFVRGSSYSSVFVLVDEHTLKHCLPVVGKHVPSLRKSKVIKIRSGEERKNMDTCIAIWRKLTKEKADRRALLVNVGGGVIGDMGGFTASAYKRGIDFVNVPTTLLAQVDASVGGKVGIDLDSCKNQIGFFKNPRGVFVHPRFLETLPPAQLRSGFAEIIKHGLIANEGYFSKVEKTPWRNTGDLFALIDHSIRIKNEIVSEDPLEKGLRKALNFGHTVGHAVESYSLLRDRKPLLHGEAIAIGMISEIWLSVRLAGLNPEKAEHVTNYLRSVYPHRDIPERTFGAIIELMKNDKKNKGTVINCSLIGDIGRISLDHKVTEGMVASALKYYNAVKG